MSHESGSTALYNIFQGFLLNWTKRMVLYKFLLAADKDIGYLEPVPLIDDRLHEFIAWGCQAGWANC
jgi:hypothetical protein